MMPRFYIRFNKSKGQPGRGSEDHVWRVFEGEKEYLVKNVRINTSSWGEKTGKDWSICCDGSIKIDRQTSTITIEGTP